MKLSVRYRNAAVAVVTVLAMAVSVVGVSSASASTTKPAPTAVAASPRHGTANVAYAGSLELLAAKVLGPKFTAKTGDGFEGTAAGSTTLAEEILDNEIDPGVFMSVGKKNIKKLWPADRSRFVIQLATDPLVVAYNPKGKWAKDFEAIADHKSPITRLFSLLSTKGMRIGRTDPNADPQGVYFILMMKLAKSTFHLSYSPAVTALGVTKSTPFGKTSQMVDEDSLITDLQAGEFDATSAYITQAIQYHLDYIRLPGSLNFSVNSELAHYATVSITLTDGTVDTGDLITLNFTIVSNGSGWTRTKSDQEADFVFAKWLLTKEGLICLKRGGYLMTPVFFTGAKSSYTPANTLPRNVLTAFRAAGGKTLNG
ncbi:MAG: substrate-binding domain-containing protein [Acidimicrobiales bacterium]|jgi:molybdate/tungstate transport system substrate-binding protein